MFHVDRYYSGLSPDTGADYLRNAQAEAHQTPLPGCRVVYDSDTNYPAKSYSYKQAPSVSYTADESELYAQALPCTRTLGNKEYVYKNADEIDSGITNIFNQQRDESLAVQKKSWRINRAISWLAGKILRFFSSEQNDGINNNTHFYPAATWHMWQGLLVY